MGDVNPGQASDELRRAPKRADHRIHPDLPRSVRTALVRAAKPDHLVIWLNLFRRNLGRHFSAADNEDQKMTGQLILAANLSAVGVALIWLRAVRLVR